MIIGDSDDNDGNGDDDGDSDDDDDPYIRTHILCTVICDDK